MRTKVGGYAHIVPPVSPYIPPIFPTSSDRTYKFIPIVDRRLLPIMKHEAGPAAGGHGAFDQRPGRRLSSSTSPPTLWTPWTQSPARPGPLTC